jgi:hypothetical protein
MIHKLLLAAIALGLWANAAASLSRPVQAQIRLGPASVESSLADIARDIHVLVTGISGCTNKKICD